jgi:hypothetical protein
MVMREATPIFKALVGQVPATRGDTVLTEDTTGSVESVNTLNLMTDVIVWTIQRGQVIHLRPSDFVYALLRDVVPAELGNNTPWELIVRDPGNRAEKVVTNGVYSQIRNNQDATLKKTLNIFRSIPPDYTLRFRINSGTAIVVANCDWVISAEMEYASI